MVSLSCGLGILRFAPCLRLVPAFYSPLRLSPSLRLSPNLWFVPRLRLTHLTLSLVLICGNLSPAVTHTLLRVWVLVIVSSVLAFHQVVRVV